ncbi:hypothetical protein [Burkholderia pseudomallei]|uniref:hypothetical protein n=1 Tax=Burkholderia pseudomallei TaxID=28450 RepID=UPI000538866D|nr:hypothetical protein [Burkholderia pseudomallei]KGX50655.1 hypothetical protein Y024_5873 [Burkholderia pseudomallei TSV44]
MTIEAGARARERQARSAAAPRAKCAIDGAIEQSSGCAMQRDLRTPRLCSDRALRAPISNRYRRIQRRPWTIAAFIA